MREVGRFNPFNGVTDEICRVFLADDLKAGTAAPDATEEFELLCCTTEEIEDMIRSKKIWDGMTLAAWMLAHHDVLEKLGR